MTSRIVTSAPFELATLGSTTLIVRGTESLRLSTSELPTLIAALEHLQANAGSTAQVSAVVPPIRTAEVAPIAPVIASTTAAVTVAPAPVAPPVPPREAVEAPAPTPAPAATQQTPQAPPLADAPAPQPAKKTDAVDLFAIVSDILRQSERPLGFNTIFKRAKAVAPPMNNLSRSLKMCLAHRTRGGYLHKLDSGRYRLLEKGAAPTRKRTNRKVPLGLLITKALEADGPASIDRLVERALEEQWVTPLHAARSVRRALSYLGEAVLIDDAGVVRLAGTKAAAAPKAEPFVASKHYRKRKRGTR